jgi:hypothetical protein
MKRKTQNEWDEFTFKANMVVAALSATALTILLITSC